MIIECDNCATRFRLDETRVTGGGVKVRCTKCENVFIVKPPREAPEASAEAPISPGAPAIAEDTAAAGEEPGVSIKIPQEEEPQEGPPQKSTDESEEYNIPKLSFGELDTLTPNTGEQDGENIEEILDAVYKDEFDAPDPAPAKDTKKNGWPDPMEVNFDSEELLQDEEPTVTGPPESPPESTPEDTPEATPEATDEATDEEEDFLGVLKDTIAEAEEKGPKVDEPKRPPQPRTPIPDISRDLGADLNARAVKPGAAPEVGAKLRPKPTASPLTGIIIAAIIFIGGGALIYFSGIIDTLSGIFVTTAAGKTVKIESLSGAFVQNTRFGKVFVVKAKLNNVTGEAQLVSGVRVTVYDKSGSAIEERTVPAGRVVSAEEIRTLSKSELMKRFNNAAGATLPPKGSIPVMAPFTGAGRTIAEYGIDVLR